MSRQSSSRQHAPVETTVSSFDAVNAFLISSLVVVGTLVSILFLIWLTMLLNERNQNQTSFVPDASFGNEKPEGFADDVFEPGVEEFPEVETPQLADALEALTDAVSSVRASIEARDGDSALMGKGGGFGSREGGPGSGNLRGVPEHKRWKIEYDTPNINEYAQQLSFFDIEIGVISNANNDVFRIRDVGNAAEVVSSSRQAENKTLFFVHEKQRLRRWDESLARRNGVDIQEKFTVQFYPDSTRQLLRQVEGQYLQQQGRELAEVRRTRFKVVPDGNGFRFQVTSVEYQ
jgi:hypothetical protein